MEQSCVFIHPRRDGRRCRHLNGHLAQLGSLLVIVEGVPHPDMGEKHGKQRVEADSVEPLLSPFLTSTSRPGELNCIVGQYRAIASQHQALV